MLKSLFVVMFCALFVSACAVESGSTTPEGGRKGGGGRGGKGGGRDQAEKGESKKPGKGIRIADERPKGAPTSITNTYTYFSCFSDVDEYSKIVVNQTLEVNGVEGYSNQWNYAAIERADGPLHRYDLVGTAQHTNYALIARYKRKREILAVNIDINMRESKSFLMIGERRIDLRCQINDFHPDYQLQVDKHRSLVANPWCQKGSVAGNRYSYTFLPNGVVEQSVKIEDGPLVRSKGRWATHRDTLNMSFADFELRFTRYSIDWGKLTVWEPKYVEFEKCN